MSSRAHVRPSVVRAEAAPERPEIRVAFGCLLAFTFILFVAPQTLVPGLEQLSLAKVAMVLGIVTALAGRLSAGLPVAPWLPESKLILGLWLWGGLSIAWSMWPGGSFELLTNEFGKSVVLFFVITSVVDSARRLRMLLASMAIWGVLVAGTVIRNYVEGHVIGFGRAVGFASPLADNPNDAALVLDLLLALSIGLFSTMRTSVGRLLLATAMGAFVVAVVLTSSRGGFIGLLVIGVVLALREWRRRPGLVIVFVVLGLLAGLLAPEGYGTRLTSIYDFASDQTGSADARWEGMIESATLMLTNPLGVGLGQNVLGLRHRGLPTWHTVHSVYLQIGAELGLVGLGIFVVACWKLVRGMSRILRVLEVVPGTEVLRALGRGVEIALLAFLAQAMVYPVAYNFYFYYLAAFSVAVRAMGWKLRNELEGLPPASSNYATHMKDWGFRRQ